MDRKGYPQYLKRQKGFEEGEEEEIFWVLRGLTVCFILQMNALPRKTAAAMLAASGAVYKNATSVPATLVTVEKVLCVLY